MSKTHRAVTRALGLAALSGLSLAVAPAATAATAATQASDSPHGMAAGEVTEGLTAMPLYPLAGGPLDLLSNNVRIPVGGTEVSTFPVTAPFRHGLPLRDVPVLGSLLP